MLAPAPPWTGWLAVGQHSSARVYFFPRGGTTVGTDRASGNFEFILDIDRWRSLTRSFGEEFNNPCGIATQERTDVSLLQARAQFWTVDSNRQVFL